MEWQNWSKTQTCYPTEIFYPENLEDVKAIVDKAAQRNKKIRCAASGHSWSSLSITEDYLVVVNNLNEISISCEGDEWVATVQPGSYISHFEEDC